MYNEKGEEILDQTPVALPVHFKRPPSIQDTIKRLVGDSEVRRALREAHVETFEEADDFNVEDEMDFHSPYEENFDKLHTITRQDEIKSGFVSDIPEPKKQWARDLVGKTKAFWQSKKAKAKADQAAAAGEAGK